MEDIDEFKYFEKLSQKAQDASKALDAAQTPEDVGKVRDELEIGPPSLLGDVPLMSKEEALQAMRETDGKTIKELSDLSALEKQLIDWIQSDE